MTSRLQMVSPLPGQWPWGLLLNAWPFSGILLLFPWKNMVNLILMAYPEASTDPTDLSSVLRNVSDVVLTEGKSLHLQQHNRLSPPPKYHQHPGGRQRCGPPAPWLGRSLGKTRSILSRNPPSCFGPGCDLQGPTLQTRQLSIAFVPHTVPFPG